MKRFNLKEENFINSELVFNYTITANEIPSFSSKTKIILEIKVIRFTNKPLYGAIEYIHVLDGKGIIKYADEINKYKRDLIDELYINPANLLKSNTKKEEIIYNYNNKTAYYVNKFKSDFDKAPILLNSKIDFYTNNDVVEYEYDGWTYLKYDGKIFRKLISNGFDIITTPSKYQGEIMLILNGQNYICINENFKREYAINIIENYISSEEKMAVYKNGKIYQANSSKNYYDDFYTFINGEFVAYKPLKMDEEILDLSDKKLIPLVNCTKENDYYNNAEFIFDLYLIDNYVVNLKKNISYISADDRFIYKEGLLYEILTTFDNLCFVLNNKTYANKSICKPYSETRASDKVSFKLQDVIDFYKDSDYKIICENPMLFDIEAPDFLNKKVCLKNQVGDREPLNGVPGIVTFQSDNRKEVKIKYLGYFEIQNISILEIDILE